jgi:histidine triad (HIT) family protein
VPKAAEHYCVFCEIIAGREPATVLFEDDDFIVFRNKLKWVPVMLLVVPKDHLTQTELWSTRMGRAGEIAAQMGREHCPNGFRALSNWGYDAMQSQEHGHIHVIGGMFLGPYA